MIPLEKNIEKIKQISKAREEENYDFRTFLKGQDYDKVDEIVHRLHEEITAQIDCTECGNCCIELRPWLSKKEIKQLAEMENMSTKDFVDQFAEKDDEGDQYLKTIPCRYLKDKKCTIYEHRPADCVSYPHTHKPRFVSRTFGMIDYLEICPIVFNLWEQLKREMHFTIR